MGYNSVVDNMGLSSAPKAAKSREILREFELIVGQGHPRSSSTLVTIERAYATSY